MLPVQSKGSCDTCGQDCGIAKVRNNPQTFFDDRIICGAVRSRAVQGSVIMIKNVVLDIGGVLVDYHTLDYYTARGYDLEKAQELKKATMDSHLWEHNDIGLMPYEWILNRMKAGAPSLADDIEKTLRLQNGVVTRRRESKDWIRAIREKGYRVLVLSNFSEMALRDCPDALDFLGENLGGTGSVGDSGVITEGILSCKVHTIKPYPAIYAHLLTRYGLIPEETVFVDDTQKNLTGAEAYGIRTVLFHSREQVLEEISKLDERS